MKNMKLLLTAMLVATVPLSSCARKASESTKDEHKTGSHPH